MLTKRHLILRWAGAASCALALCLSTAATAKTFNVRDFGAVGDGKTADTAAIQKAIDAAGKEPGATVLLNAGTYLSGPLFLRSKITLYVNDGAVLKATDEPKDYLPSNVAWDDILQGRSKGPFTNFINGKDLEDLKIEGKGIIDGSGERWWEPAEAARRKVSGYTLPRPNLVRIVNCKGLKVSGVTLQNAPKFHLIPENCDDVLIENVTILAPERAANTDAIDPTASRRVTITHCLIDVGDDNVAIKAGKKIPGREFACEDITITDCTFKHGHGLSIGSETAGGVKNLVVKNCTFEGTENGIRIKSPRGKGGKVENLIYENLTMKNVKGAITFTCYYPKIPKTDTAQPMTEETPAFRNIRIKNLKATSSSDAGVIVGLPESHVMNVTLEDVRIEAAKAGLLIQNADAIKLKDVKVTCKSGPPVIIENADVEGADKASK